jgi:hypothetical protein
VERHIELRRGERRSIAVHLVPRPLAVDRASVFESPWLWVAVGAIAVGGTVTLVLLTQEDGLRIAPPFGHIEALR